MEPEFEIGWKGKNGGSTNFEGKTTRSLAGRPANGEKKRKRGNKLPWTHEFRRELTSAIRKKEESAAMGSQKKQRGKKLHVRNLASSSRGLGIFYNGKKKKKKRNGGKKENRPSGEEETELHRTPPRFYRWSLKVPKSIKSEKEKRGQFNGKRWTTQVKKKRKKGIGSPIQSWRGGHYATWQPKEKKQF